MITTNGSGDVLTPQSMEVSSLIKFLGLPVEDDTGYLTLKVRVSRVGSFVKVKRLVLGANDAPESVEETYELKSNTGNPRDLVEALKYFLGLGDLSRIVSMELDIAANSLPIFRLEIELGGDGSIYPLAAYGKINAVKT